MVEKLLIGNGSYSIWGTSSTAQSGVRPLIILTSNCKVIKNSSNDGSTKEKACILYY